MNYTSIEQSKKLLELGLSPESADMHYPDYYFDGNAKYPCNTPYKEAIEDLFHVYINPKTKRLLPCWSLGALLQSAPKYFSKENHQFVQSYSYDHIDGCYHFIYRDYQHGGRSKYISKNKDLFDAAFEMIIWLLENDYIKRNNN